MKKVFYITLNFFPRKPSKKKFFPNNDYLKAKRENNTHEKHVNQEKHQNYNNFFFSFSFFFLLSFNSSSLKQFKK